MLLADIFFISFVLAVGLIMLILGLIFAIKNSAENNLPKTILSGLVAITGIALPLLGLPALYGLL